MKKYKKIIFLIILAICLFKPTRVDAATFYEAEYINNIYVSKYNPRTATVHFQLARFFRRTDTNEFVYCIEPFTFFDESIKDYHETITPDNLSQKQMERIVKIAHYGYNYHGRDDPRWYIITQMMIWQEADPSASFYFTDGLNGNKIDVYQNEMKAINSYIDMYDSKPDLQDTYYIKEGESLEIEADPIVLRGYKSNNPEVTKKENKLVVSPLAIGEYSFSLYKDDNEFNKPYIFYQSSTNQNMLEYGDINFNRISFNVKVVNPTITITKEDEETGTIPQGEAKLDGTIIGLYDEVDNLIDEYEIVDNYVTIDNLDLGKYYIKEKQPGEGYLLNDEKIEVTLDGNDYNKEIEILNKVIKKEIKIIKNYGVENNFQKEKDIEFEIYDINNNLIDTIITDEFGEASITLPYGQYTFIQKNSTTGYNKVEPFVISVNDTEEEIIELKDYKIPVPNTKISIIKMIIIKLILLLI